MKLQEVREAVAYHLPKDPEQEPVDIDLNTAVWALEQLRAMFDTIDKLENEIVGVSDLFAEAFEALEEN